MDGIELIRKIVQEEIARYATAHGETIEDFENRISHLEHGVIAAGAGVATAVFSTGSNMPAHVMTGNNMPAHGMTGNNMPLRGGPVGE